MRPTVNKKEQFKKTMHDYSNILEYYNYYGHLIYISSSYFSNQDYFIILKTHKYYAVVKIDQEDQMKFAAKKNRNALIEDLDALESNLHWVVPTGLKNYFDTTLTQKDFPDRAELIKLKNLDITKWNHYQLENLIRAFRLDHTLASRGIHHNIIPQGNIVMSHSIVEGLYNTNFTFNIEWIVGNPFMDIKINHFGNHTKRRLYLHDIQELGTVFGVVSQRTEDKTIESILNFVDLNR
jgi:hypothetical protein